MGKNVTRDELKSILNKYGWRLHRSNGNHMIFWKDGVSQRVAVGSQGMGGGGLKEILNRFEIPLDEIMGSQYKKEAQPEMPRAGSGEPLPLEVIKARGGSIPKEGTFGRRLWDSRRNAGLGQKEVAELIGCSSAAVGFWEKEINVPSHENMLALANVFGWKDVQEQFHDLNGGKILKLAVEAEGLPAPEIPKAKAEEAAGTEEPGEAKEAAAPTVSRPVPSPAGEDGTGILEDTTITGSQVIEWITQVVNENRSLRYKLSKFGGVTPATLEEIMEKAEKWDKLQEFQKGL